MELALRPESAPPPGGGTRLFDERAAAVELEPTGVVEAPDVTHLREAGPVHLRYRAA